MLITGCALGLGIAWLMLRDWYWCPQQKEMLKLVAYMAAPSCLYMTIWAMRRSQETLKSRYLANLSCKQGLETIPDSNVP
jgi:hypothetical protein